MDLSALIFVALAVAWAVYLIPKALKQHEDSANSRSIDTFSARLRVLGRREPLTASSATLVTSRGARRPVNTAAGAPAARATTNVAITPPVAAPAVQAAVEAATLTPAQLRIRRAAAARAARRRLRVVLTILVAVATVAILAGVGTVSPVYVLIPVGVLVAWLVACRLMVKREIAALPQVRLPITVPAPHEDPSTEELPAVVVAENDDVEGSSSEAAAPTDDAPAPAAGGWDPVPTTLPTYVAKEPAARRTVRTIDLDSTGVWSSGRNAADAELVREAEASGRSAQPGSGATPGLTAEQRRRAAGS